MRTAKEMFDYCMAQKLGSGFSSGNNLRHFEVIDSKLQPDEDVLFVFIGLHNYKSISKHDNNFAYAISNKRILMGQKKVIGEVFQSIALDQINDVTFSTGLALGIITVDTIKEKFNVALDKGQASNINDRIHELLFSLKEQTREPAPASSGADELRKYKSLLDDGIISKEEFDKKKAQILGL
jgi:hypothetical protein